MTLVRSVSGVRGVVGTDVTEELVGRYAVAFGSTISGDAAVGWDGRRGGDVLAQAAMRGLVRAGVGVLDAGVVPTPTIGIAVRERRMGGGIAVTASHNPEDHNGLKFFSSRGVFLDGEAIGRLFSLVDGGIEQSDAEVGGAGLLEGAVRAHVDLVLASEFVDRERTREEGIKVVVDCVNAAGSLILPDLLRELGCTVLEVNTDLGAGFTRGPEPVPENLARLGEAVVDAGADVGLACDPDADRLAVVDGEGRSIGEEYTLAVAARSVLARRRGAVVANVSTSRMLDDLAGEFGVPIHRSAVGEANVVAKMEEVSAVVGGEGNGGVILPGVHMGRDACAAAALIVGAIAAEGRGGVAGLVGRLPRYAMVKRKAVLEGVSGGLIESSMLRAFPGAVPDLLDGAKMAWPDRWVHARMSGTEPVVRVIAEALSASAAEDLAERALLALSRATGGGPECAE